MNWAVKRWLWIYDMERFKQPWPKMKLRSTITGTWNQERSCSILFDAGVELSFWVEGRSGQWAFVFKIIMKHETGLHFIIREGRQERTSYDKTPALLQPPASALFQPLPPLKIEGKRAREMSGALHSRSMFLLFLKKNMKYKVMTHAVGKELRLVLPFSNNDDLHLYLSRLATKPNVQM